MLHAFIVVVQAIFAQFLLISHRLSTDQRREWSGFFLASGLACP